MTVLVLMRHGDADISTPDTARALTELGRTQSARSADWLRARNLAPAHAIVSTARRAVETFYATELTCEMTATHTLYECSGTEIIDQINTVPDNTEVLLIVGHIPGIPEAAVELTDNESLPGFTPATLVVVDLAPGPATRGSGALRDWFSP